MDLAPVVDDIRAAIAVRHGVTVRDVLLTLPERSRGRPAARSVAEPAARAYLDGTLRSGKIANAFPDETD